MVNKSFVSAAARGAGFKEVVNNEGKTKRVILFALSLGAIYVKAQYGR